MGLVFRTAEGSGRVGNSLVNSSVPRVLDIPRFPIELPRCTHFGTELSIHFIKIAEEQTFLNYKDLQSSEGPSKVGIFGYGMSTCLIFFII